MKDTAQVQLHMVSEDPEALMTLSDGKTEDLLAQVHGSRRRCKVKAGQAAITSPQNGGIRKTAWVFGLDCRKGRLRASSIVTTPCTSCVTRVQRELSAKSAFSGSKVNLQDPEPQAPQTDCLLPSVYPKQDLL